jgi:predicted RNase H-like HicB family nuclease
MTAAITKEGNLYVAQCLEIEVASQGQTVEEAINNLREAVELLLEDEGVLVRPTPLLAQFQVALAA